MPSTLAKLSPEILDRVIRDSCGTSDITEIILDSERMFAAFVGSHEAIIWNQAMAAAFNDCTMAAGQALLIMNAFRLGWKACEACSEIAKLEALSAEEER